MSYSTSPDASGASEMSSLFSYPMTRASSAATEYSQVDSLVTPIEKQSKHELNGPRRMSRSHGHVQSIDVAHCQNRLDPVVEAVEPGYFSIPIQHTSMQRNNAKELIHRFESLQSANHISQGKPSRQEFGLRGFDTHAGSRKLESRSPLRRSFGNLLAIFGKKPKTSVKNEGNLLPVPCAPNIVHSAQKANTNQYPVSPVQLHSRSLSYLSPPLSSSAAYLPVWTDTTVTLYSTRIIVTWHTSRGNPHSRIIQLASCTDVHSLTSAELDPDETALLPSREVKPFELLFKDNSKEKFVASNIQERAGWISAIWNAILAIQDRKNAASILSAEPSEYLVDILDRPACSQNESKLSLANVDRDLPPTPPCYSPDSHSTRPHALLVPSTSSPRSASILNLSKRSVVTQRLNQIENSSPRPRSRQNTINLGSDLNRRASTRSTDGDSLLDLYEVSPIARVPATLMRSGWTSPELPLIPEVSPQVSEIIQSQSHSPLSTYTAANNDMKLGPLVELLQDQATKHYYHTSDIRDQIASLHNEIHGMFEELKVAVGDQPADQIVKFAETVNNSMVELERKLREVKNEEGFMQHIGEKLESIHADIRSIKDSGASGGGIVTQTAVRNLEELRTTVEQQDGVPQMIVQELEKLRLALGVTDEASDVVLRNLGSSTAAKGSTADNPNLTEVNAKLDLLLDKWKENAGGICGALNHQELNDFTALLKAEQTQRSTQVAQQVDSVRYLNELNAWLEKFVNDGTSKIDAVSSGVQQLQKELGCDSQESGEATRGGLLENIQLLLAESKERDQSLAVLHASVNGLFAAVSDRIADPANIITSEAIVGLLDQQHKHQEQMLRNIAADLSNDIKGERLRFVEAMQEATAINVQGHVEEFKKQLTKEVFFMTQEVERLQRERQSLEQQISDLFTFYAKQKQLTAGIMGFVPPPPGGLFPS